WCRFPRMKCVCSDSTTSYERLNDGLIEIGSTSEDKDFSNEKETKYSMLKRPGCIENVCALEHSYHTKSDEPLDLKLSKIDILFFSARMLVAISPENPRVFKNINKSTLLVYWGSNKKTWMTTFADEDIEMMFLPPNTTSLIQPCDRGITSTFKLYYLRLTSKQMLHESQICGGGTGTVLSGNRTTS
ncbi:hypothetical protein Trydic_g10271, partial [Trypoxylus dichotomus]